MNRKHLRKVVDSFGLQLMHVENGTGNGMNIVVRAPDSTEARFMVSRIDDVNSDRINTAQLHRFARDHTQSLPLPTVEELDDLPLNNMSRAMIAAHEALPVPVVRVAKRLLSTQPLLNPEHTLQAMREEMLLPQHEDYALNGGARAPMTEDPILDHIETIETLIEKEPEMPRKSLTKPVLTPVASTPVPPADKPKRTVERFGQVEFFKLCTVLNSMDMSGISSLTKLSERLTDAYGKNVPTGTAKDALDATGKKLDKAITVVNATQAEVIIAKVLTSLLIKLNEPVPNELRSICGDIE